MDVFSTGLSVLADAADKAITAQPVEAVDIGFRLLVLIALFVVPYIVGAVLSRLLRVKDYSNRFGTVLLAFSLGLAPFGFHIIKAGKFDAWKDALRWGIDLAGGTNLIYQVDIKSAIDKNIPVAEAMDKMISTIAKRINPSGTEEVTVRKVGDSRIEIIIPGADQGVVAEKKAAMVRLGSLEFGIVANEKDHRSWLAAARALPNTQDNLLEGNQIVAVWRTIAEKADSMPASSVRTVLRKDKQGKDAPIKQVLIVQDPEEDLVTGSYLRRASPSISEDGSPCVNFSFDNEGAMRFFRLTSRNRPASDGTKRQLAIILDAKVHSAPNINSAIRDSGQITGNFPPDELKALVDVLNAGALQLPIDPTPISEFTISPLLGADVQNKGLLAIYISSLAVFVFMFAYYRFAGLVANISLILNMVLIIGSMAICNATITLPGLAGMVLTIGMAVDSNVLIYERMREEMERGSSLRMMIHNGFDKALSAIVDSNVTTLIAAVVLYMIGTDQIKGFAVSLFIGLTMSMFSVLYFGRLMFDFAERKRLIRDKLTMLKLIGVTNFDFIGKLKIALTGSISFIVIGVVMVIARGTESLDIDFAGGSMLTFKFVNDQQIDDVRSKLQDSGKSKKELSSISLERLALPDDPSPERGKQYRLRTKETDVTEIRKAIAATFTNLPNYELQRVTVDFTPITKSASAATGNLDQATGARGEDEVKTDAPKTDAKADESKKDEKPAAETPAAKKETEKDESAKPEKKEETPVVEKAESDPPKSEGDSSKTETKPTSGTGVKLDPGSTNPFAELGGSADPFANAYRTELSFTSEISATTAEEYLLAELKKINPAYTDSRALFRTTGTSGKGMESAENKVKTYDKMLLEVRNTVDEAELTKALIAMQETLRSTPIFEEVSNFAPSVAEDMRYYALLALLASGVGTVVYLWFRFTKADFGIAAVVAVFHDVLFTLACLPMAYYLSKTPLGPILGLEDFKLNLSIIAAFMTIIGYSLNDTSVIFDRVREIRGRNRLLTPQMVNDSVNQTLSRTILTAVTVFITVAILYFIGGDGIHGFAFCMLIGTLVGCYSTIYIASPILLWMWNREQKQREAGRL